MTLLANKSLQRNLLIAAVVVATVLYIYAAWISRFNLSNVDGISYISIAKQYAEGLTSYAVNGYWSPLVSWLMAPFIALGVEPLFSFMLVNAISAIVGTSAAMALVWRITRGHFWATSIIFVVTFSLYLSQALTITPDSWVVTWTTLFAWTLIEVDKRLHPGTIRDRIIGGAAIGAMGAVGYFTKQYLIPVFIVTVIIWFVFRILADRKEYKPVDRKEAVRRWLIAPAATLLAAVLVAGPWVTALSLKYGELTMGSSFSVNIGMKFDPVSGEEIRDPLEVVEPPNEYAVAFGEDRGTEVAEDGGFQSSSPILSRIKFYIVERFAVFPFYLQKIGSFAPFAFVLLFGMLAAMTFRWVDFRKHRESVSVLILGLVYFTGYAGITQVQSAGGNARYYWPVLTLSALMLALIVPALWTAVFANANRWRKLVAIIAIAIVPFAAFTQNLAGYPYVFSTIKASTGLGWMIGEPGKPVPYDLAEEIKVDGTIPPHTKLLANNYRMTLRLAYYLDAQAYGRSGHFFDITNPALREVMEEKDIDLFLRYTPADETAPDVSEFATVVKTYTTDVTCSDERSAPIELCNVELIKLK